MRIVIAGTACALLIAAAILIYRGASDPIATDPGSRAELPSRQSLDLTFAGIESPHGARSDAATAPREFEYEVAGTKSLFQILSEHGVSDESIVSLVTSSRAAHHLRDLSPGDRLRFVVAGSALEHISVDKRVNGQTLTFGRADRGYTLNAATNATDLITKPADRGFEKWVRMEPPPAPVVASPSGPAKTAQTTQTPTPRADSRPVRAANSADGASETPKTSPTKTPRAPKRRVVEGDVVVASATPLGTNSGGARKVSLASRPEMTSLPDTRTRIRVRKGDSLYGIFKSRGYSLDTLNAILRGDRKHKRLRAIQPGRDLYLTFDDDRRIQSLSYQRSRSETATYRRDGKRFTADIAKRHYERRVLASTITIQSSLFAAANKAALPDAIAIQLVEIFGWDIDFAFEIRPGDSFTVLYESLYLDGRFVKSGDVLAAAFNLKTRNVRAVRYELDGRVDYFTPDGHRLRRAFIRTPVKFARISSGFSKRRKHPILHRFRAHKGVDYAAPRGTPIRATGDGRIKSIGYQRGYGKTIVLQHGSGNYTTLYAHMSRFAKGMHKGGRVQQGQTIGYVGSTGQATGPHLHYEFRVNGVHRNPLTVPLPRTLGLSKAERVKFRAKSRRILSRLASAGSTTLAQADVN